MDIAKLIDHTFLGAAGDEGAVRKLCREAKRYGFASVCVNPAEVELAVRLLKNSAVKVCTVIGFPLGQNTANVKCAEALQALDDGAEELDVVINQRLLRHDPFACYYDLQPLVEEVRERKLKTVLKLILECCNLTDAEIKTGCKIAMRLGFDFVKTSTGFGKGGATVKDVELMRRCVGRKLGVKAAGGIRTLADAKAMIAAGATRLGCSAGVAIVKGS